MKLNTFLLLSAISFSTLSFDAFSHDENQSNKCSSIGSIICSDQKVISDIDNKLIENLNKEIRAEAYQNKKAELNAVLSKIPKFRIFYRAITEEKIIANEMSRISKSKYGDLESVFSEENVEKIREYLFRAIDNSNIKDMYKAEFKNNVSKTAVYTYSNFLNLLDIDNPKSKDADLKFCGDDGLTVNAFWLDIKEVNKFGYLKKEELKDKNGVIVICPGLQLTSVPVHKTEKDKFEQIIFVLGHEFAHSIDSAKVGATPYVGYLSCVLKNYSKKLIGSKEVQKYCKLRKTSPEQCLAKVTMNYANELTSDIWAQKVVNEYYKDQNLDSNQLLATYKSGFQKLCGAKDLGSHPSTEFRLDINLLMQPELNEALGCDNKVYTENRSCTF